MSRMGAGHSQARRRADSPRAGDDVEVGFVARVVLLGTLALCALGTVVGLVHYWPDGGEVDRTLGDVQFAAPGVTFPHAEVVAVRGQDLVTRVLEGESEGERAVMQVPRDIARSGLRPGDIVELQRNPTIEGVEQSYSFFGVDRSRTLWLLLGGFLLAVVLVARLRGVLALLGLIAGGFVLTQFMLPALLLGASGLGVAMVGSAAIMFVALYLAHGPSLRTSAALAGSLAGIAITAVIGLAAIRSARLSGVNDDAGAILASYVDGVSFTGLLACALIVAGLGVLNDVTITQSSAVWELRAAAPGMTRPALFRSAMRIGRDHIASTIYTIVFAYAGTALSVLLLLYLYQRPATSTLTAQPIATEVITTLATAIGLVLSVPITTGIAALTVGAPRAGHPAWA
jgi:uncharacterized membrane protein